MTEVLKNAEEVLEGFTTKLKVAYDDADLEGLMETAQHEKLSSSQVPEIVQVHAKMDKEGNIKKEQLTEEHGHMKKQLTKIETKSLEHCLIIRGLPEELKETEQMMHDKLHTSLSTIMQGETEEEKLDNAKQIVIKNCRRLGRFSKNRS